MADQEKPIKLGNLLIEAGIITSDQFDAAVQTAVTNSRSISEILTSQNAITSELLDQAVQTLNLLKQKLIDLETGVKALKEIGTRRTNLEEALEHVQTLVEGERLGELMSDSGLVSKKQVKEALAASEENGLPLGANLVSLHNVSDESISAALTAQVLLRDKKITRAQAIKGLKAFGTKRLSLESALADQGYIAKPSTSRVKLGELYILANLLAESELVLALERGLAQKKQLGQILVQSNLTTDEVLEAALKLQQMISERSINALEAGQALRKVALQRDSLSEVLARIQSPTLEPDDAFNLASLLESTNIVPAESIQNAIKASAKNSNLLGRMLQATGAIDDNLLNSLLRAQRLLRENALTLEQAVIALKQCRQTGESFDQVARELGWIARRKII